MRERSASIFMLAMGFFACTLFFSAEALRAEDAPAHTEDAPAHAEEKPAHTEDAPAQAEEKPAHTEDAPAHAEEKPVRVVDPNAPQLYKSVRALQTLQDAMVAGDANAQKVRVKLIASIAAEAAEGKFAAANDRRNIRAAIVYILSGGPPEVGQPFLADPDIDPASKLLLEGAIAYARGEKSEAAEKLLPADLEGLPPALAGQIALIRSSLRKAGEFDLIRLDLNLARKLMPGTLGEESALRRGAIVEAEAKDRVRLERIASIYFRRFPRSIYAGQFVTVFVRFIAELGYADTPQSYPNLDQMISELPPDRAAYVFLELSHHAVLRGQRALAVFTAHRALSLAKPATPDISRARLYLAAVLVSGAAEEHDDALALLAQVERGALIGEDNVLMDQAETVARTIRRETFAVPGPLQTSKSTNPAAQRALEALGETDRVLGEDGA